MALEVLVVDDEADIRDLVSGVLEDEGYAVRTAADSSAALEAIEERRPSLVLLDVWLQGSKLDGLQLLEEIKRRDPTLPVLMISGHGNLDTAVAAIREGAVDFIEKPFEAEPPAPPGRPRDRDRAAAARERQLCASRSGRRTSSTALRCAINTVRATLKRVAPTGSRVLITGPAGVGKEVAARTDPPVEPARQRALHRRLGGADEPRSGSRRNCSARGRRASPGPACSSRPMAAPCSSTRSPTCR